VTESADIFARTLLIDAGPFVAALDRTDEHHAWAKRTLPKLRGRVVTCEACLAEALHLLENAPAAIGAMRRLLEQMEVIPVLTGDLQAVFGLVSDFAPNMDLADGCLVALQRRTPRSIVVTTDHSDFSVYRVPFLSPQGLFSAN
jgi:predicted nucleic acid-binding protein